MKTKKKYLRYAIYALIIAIGIPVCVFSYYLIRHYQAYQYYHTFDSYRIHMSSGYFPDAIDFHHDGKYITDVDILPLRNLMFLKYLDIGYIDISDDEFISAVARSGLRYLGISNIPISDRGLSGLSKCYRLDELDIYDLPNLTGKSLMYISQCHGINRLKIKGMRFKQGDLQYLKDMKNLHHLILWDCQFDSPETIDEFYTVLESTDLSLTLNSIHGLDEIFSDKVCLEKNSSVDLIKCDYLDKIFQNMKPLPKNFRLGISDIDLKDCLLETFPELLDGTLSLRNVKVTLNGIRSFLERQIELRKERNDFCPLPVIECFNCEFSDDEELPKVFDTLKVFNEMEELKKVINEMERKYVRVVEENKQ